MLMPTSIAFTIVPSPVPLLRYVDLPHPERAVERGRLVRVRHGIYVDATAWSTLPLWSRYLVRVHAVAIACPGAVFSHESAAALAGMPVFGDPVIVHLLVPPSSAARFSGGVRTHRTSEDRVIVESGGIALTSPADTAVDLARHRHSAIGLAVADAALRLDSELTVDALVESNEARSSSRGRANARWSLSHATREAETALESVSRSIIGWLGFPAPELQVTFISESGDEDRTDFLWRESSLAGEADGDLKYDGRFGDPLTALRRQSERDARLRSPLRAVAHWGWADATAVAPLRSLLTGMGLQAIAPENTAQLFTVRRLLAPRAPHQTRSAQASSGAPSATHE